MTEMSRRALLRSGLAMGTGALASGLLAAPALGREPAGAAAFVRSGRPRISHGVQAGDVRATEATVWARADRPSRLVVELSRDASFRSPRRLRGPVVTPDTDLTGRVRLTGLRPGSGVHYRVYPLDLDGRAAGQPESGRLRTAPLRRDDVSFV